jgi:prophage antirepressor-like protein
MIEMNGEPYFVGKDVAEILGYSDTNKAVVMHVDDEDKILNDKSSPSFGQRGATLINESGLYSLILLSKLPEAKKFKRWVTSEILPSIRKTGSYSIEQKPDSYTIEDPAARARRWAEEYEEKKALEIKNTELVEQNDKLVTENKYMKPKAAYFDALVDRETLTNFRDTAHELNIPQVAFIDFLKDNNYIYFKGSGKNRQIRAYAEPVKDGLFTLKEFTNKHNGFKGVQVFVTPKGRNVFGKLLGAIERYIDD